jgi:hypothetical protein
MFGMYDRMVCLLNNVGKGCISAPVNRNRNTVCEEIESEYPEWLRKSENFPLVRTGATVSTTFVALNFIPSSVT